MTVIYNPVAPALATERALAPRLSSLTGARIGLLDNSKSNAGGLLTAVRQALIADFGATEGPSLRKGSAGQPASEETLAALVAGADLILTGSADCGSCSSASVQDTVSLEERGLPTILLGTDAFEDLARQLSSWLDLPDIMIAPTPHPLGGIDAEAVSAKGVALASTVAVLAVTH